MVERGRLHLLDRVGLMRQQRKEIRSAGKSMAQE
jgi:hypothetical protein